MRHLSQVLKVNWLTFVLDQILKIYQNFYVVLSFKLKKKKVNVLRFFGVVFFGLFGFSWLLDPIGVTFQCILPVITLIVLSWSPLAVESLHNEIFAGPGVSFWRRWLQHRNKMDLPTKGKWMYRRFTLILCCVHG